MIFLFIPLQDAQQRLDEFSGAVLDPRQLARSCRPIALLSRAHRDTVAATPFRLAVPVLELWRLRRLQACLAWMGRLRLAELSMAGGGLTQYIAAELDHGLAEHAPACRAFSNTVLSLVGMQPGEVFDAGGS